MKQEKGIELASVGIAMDVYHEARADNGTKLNGPKWGFEC